MHEWSYPIGNILLDVYSYVQQFILCFLEHRFSHIDVDSKMFQEIVVIILPQ